MVISHQHKFLFIHLGKTAGTSIREALEPHATPFPRHRLAKIKSRLGIVTDHRTVYLPVHANCRYAQRRLPPEVFDSLFKFAFVRNPWDMLVSSYHYIQSNTRHHRHRKVSQMPDLEAFIRYEIKRGKFFQVPQLVDESGAMAMDVVGHFETLVDDFNSICARIGIDASLPHANSSKHRPYTDYYSDSLRELVADHWAADIEAFGYTFEGMRPDAAGATSSP